MGVNGERRLLYASVALINLHDDGDNVKENHDHDNNNDVNYCPQPRRRGATRLRSHREMLGVKSEVKWGRGSW